MLCVKRRPDGDDCCRFRVSIVVVVVVVSFVLNSDRVLATATGGDGQETVAVITCRYCRVVDDVGVAGRVVVACHCR